MKEVLGKYSNSVVKNFNKENSLKILEFLNNNSCDFMDDVCENYLDLLGFDYEVFKYKYNKLNKKYDNKFLSLAGDDMNLLEEFYII